MIIFLLDGWRAHQNSLAVMVPVPKKCSLLQKRKITTGSNMQPRVTEVRFFANTHKLQEDLPHFCAELHAKLVPYHQPYL